MTAQSWFKFYPSDWRGDAKLQACSIAARGLWIELMAIMHEATPYGHLAINDRPMSYYRIAQLVRAERKQVQRLMAHLKTRGVFGVTSRGILYSRRMVRDEAKRQQLRALKNKRNYSETFTQKPERKKEGQTEEGKRRKQGAKTKARHRWENDLRLLGTERHAEIMDALAAHPELIERATGAELRKPGSGVMVVVIGEKRLRETA